MAETDSNKEDNSTTEQNSSSFLFIRKPQLHTVRLQGCEVELFIPDADDVQQAYRRGRLDSPFWTKIWPAAIAMTEYLELYPELVNKKYVLELGAGLGLPSLFSARFASFVRCTDNSGEAIAFANLSAKHNQLTNFCAEELDWNNLPVDIDADLILLSDINYEPTAFAVLKEMIFTFLRRHKTILLSTPQRLMAKEFIQLILPFCRHQEEKTISLDGTVTAVSILLLQH